MLASVRWRAGDMSAESTVDLPTDESGFWGGVASFLGAVPVPCEMEVSCPYGSASFEVSQRGSWFDNGEERPSMYVRETFNGIEGLSPSAYPKTYLVCVNPESRGGEGSYKYYEMEQVSEREIVARYGPCEGHRGRHGSTAYPSRLYWVRFSEKLSKGYRDRSREYLGEKVGNTSDPIPACAVAGGASASERLYADLLAWAERRCRADLRQGVDVTAEMAKEARRCLNNMAMCKSVPKFNSWIRSLIEVSPRSASVVSAFFAKSEADFARIVRREEDLVAAMEAVASSASRKRGAGAKDAASFDGLGVEVSEVALEDAPSVASALEGLAVAKVRRVFEVVPQSQRARFLAYRKERGIEDKDVRLLWHGSRNENWLSIIENSLMLNPVSAVRTGAMFGPGIYFAPSARKSFGYTSFRGSYWASGKSGTAYMGLYECAYGKPCVVQSAGRYDKEGLDTMGKDCVHAYAGCSGLRNEEIVFYDEAAVCLKYLVEFCG